MNLLPPDTLMHDPLATARDWLNAHGRIGLATVVSTWGSSPVPVGGQLVIGPGDRFRGSVAGGCVETDVIAGAPSVMESGKPLLFEFGVTDDAAWRVGLPCGGKIKVFLQRLEGVGDLGVTGGQLTRGAWRAGVVEERNARGLARRARPPEGQRRAWAVGDEGRRCVVADDRQ